jgi:putative transposase
MWTDDARDKYRMIARGYPSSMSDAEWALVEPYFPSPAATAVHGLLRGKDMLHPMRRIVDAIFYVLRNGVTWRALPLDFPPWQTVYYWFRRFARAALFEQLNAVLVALDRVAAGRDAQPTAAIIDSQTVKATEAPAPRDYDANKKLTGLKRHALVDVDGRFLIIGFSTARLHDSIGGAALLKAAKLQCPFLELTWGPIPPTAAQSSRRPPRRDGWKSCPGSAGRKDSSCRSADGSWSVASRGSTAHDVFGASAKSSWKQSLP